MINPVLVFVMFRKENLTMIVVFFFHLTCVTLHVTQALYKFMTDADDNKQNGNQ